MSMPIPADVLQDEFAVSIACVVAAANKQARAVGVDVPKSHVTIAERTVNGKPIWRVSYGPKDYIIRRGGGFLVDIDPVDGSVLRTLRGQ